MTEEVQAGIAAGEDSQEGQKFTQEDVNKIAGNRAKEAEQRAINNLLKKAEAESIDEILEGYQAYRVVEDEIATEADKLKTQLQKIDTEREAERTNAASHLGALRAERLSNTAERLAVKLGGKPERAEGIARLADLAGVEFGEDNKPDAKQVEAAIKTTLEEYPELRASKAVLDEGFNPPGSLDTLETGEKNPFVEGPHFNLTRQGELFLTNPQLAGKLQKAAKG